MKASSRHNYLCIISCFHGPQAQSHHHLSHTPVSKEEATALSELASLFFDVTALRFHESQLCSEHRQLDPGAGVAALLEGLSCVLEDRLQEEKGYCREKTGKIVTKLQVYRPGLEHRHRTQHEEANERYSPTHLTLVT